MKRYCRAVRVLYRRAALFFGIVWRVWDELDGIKIRVTIPAAWAVSRDIWEIEGEIK